MSGADLNNDANSDVKPKHFSMPTASQVSVSAGDDLEIIVDSNSETTKTTPVQVDRRESTPVQSAPLELDHTELAQAHAAIVLARAQSSAARREESVMRNHLKRLEAELEILVLETLGLTTELETSRKQYIDLDKRLSVEQAKLSELRASADREHLERLRLAKRVEELSSSQQSFWSKLFSR